MSPPDAAANPSLDAGRPAKVAASMAASPTKKATRLLFFHEIPTWQKDNEFLLSGYRPTSGSVLTSLASLRYLNNQSVNTYSHLIGAFVFAALPIYLYRDVPPVRFPAVALGLVFTSVYCYAVSVCFLLSAIFHLLWNHSPDVSRFCNRLDYVGILVLMWGAGIPTIYYGFLCDPWLQLVYWTMTSSSALCCAIFTLSPSFVRPQFRRWRAGFYAGFGLSSIIYVIHGLFLYGWQVQKARMSLAWMGWMAAANLAGAVVYAARVPERFVPYAFDHFGASHQILHLAVMAAAWIHFRGLMEAFEVIRSQEYICAGVWDTGV